MAQAAVLGLALALLAAVLSRVVAQQRPAPVLAEKTSSVLKTGMAGRAERAASAGRRRLDAAAELCTSPWFLRRRTPRHDRTDAAVASWLLGSTGLAGAAGGWRAAVEVGYCAEEAGRTKDEGGEPLRFRRVFAPADRMKDWPRGAMKYLPVDAAEFDRLLATVRDDASGVGVSSGVRIESAQYAARWDEAQTLRGDATLQIAHRAGGPRPAAAGTLQPGAGQGPLARRRSAPAAVLGLDDGGKLQMLVERAGQLGAAWSLRGRRDAGDATVFSFELPPCPVNRLTLDLPPGLTPLADRGLQVDSRPAGEELRPLGDRAGRPQPLSPSHRAGRRRRTSSAAWPWRGSRWSTTSRFAAWKSPRS